MSYGAVGRKEDGRKEDEEEGNASVDTLLLHPRVNDVWVSAPQQRAGGRARRVVAGLVVAGVALAVVATVVGLVKHGRREDRGLSGNGEVGLTIPSQLHSMHKAARFKTDGQRLVLNRGHHWGTVNPDTGMMRCQCDDTVSKGSFGSHDPALMHRFYGKVGDRYTVECPRGCSQANTPVYGCGDGPYMDESSICAAALGLQLFGDDSGGIVTFELVEPVASYASCTMDGLNDLDEPADARGNLVPIGTQKWQWYKWRWSERPASIQRFCSDDWIASNPGVPCEKAIKKYRTSCAVTGGVEHCFGEHAFKFITPCPPPVITPSKGTFADSAEITVTPSEPDPTAYIVCTTDGSAPDASGKGKMPPVPADGIIKLSPGKYTVQCQAASSAKGPSRFVRAQIDVLPRLPVPEIDPESGETFVSDVMVSIDSEEGATIYYTTDGSDPTTDSTKYDGPFELSTIGSNSVKAIAQKTDWADSHVASSEIRLLQRVAEPTYEPYTGAFTNTVTVHLESETEGAKIRFTTDGSQPSAASPEYSPADGLVLGLSADGTQATYVIKAIAELPPDMGDSYVATSGEIVVQPAVVAPVITPESEGPYKDSVLVTIICATDGATIRFTTDGSDPTPSSAVYLAPLELTQTGIVVKAQAFAPKMTASDVSESLPFVLEASDPTISPDGGEFVDTVQVTLASATVGATVHYTLDGTDPTASSPVYLKPVVISTTDITVKAVAMHSNLVNSNVVTSSGFNLKASPPVFDPSEGGSWIGMAKIQVTSATPGAKLRCTYDGSEPTENVWTAHSPLSVRKTNTMVRCIATHHFLQDSDVSSMDSPVIIRAKSPTMTPDGGDFTNQASVVMSCSTPGCTIRYTTDGSMPVPTSILYTEPVVVKTSGTVLKCIAVADGKSASDVAASNVFTVRASAPTFEATGTAWHIQDEVEEDYVEKANITMESKTADAVIVYTVDGSEPTGEHGTKYLAPYEDTKYGQETIKAISFAKGMLPSPVSTSVIYDIIHKAPMPAITPDSGGPFTDHVQVTIDCTLREHPHDSQESLVVEKAGAKCFYTTDGSEPTLQSTGYEGPFVISALGSTVIKAIMTTTHQADSDVAEASFLVLEQVKAPTFDISSGTFTDSVTIHLSCVTPMAVIRYTTDGTEPNAGSDAYNSDTGLTLSLPADGKQVVYTIKALAMNPPEMGDSIVVSSGELTVQPQVATPAITPDASTGPFKDKVMVSISCDTDWAQIWYTMDGSDPASDANRHLYTEPFEMKRLSPAKDTIRAVATKRRMAMSEEAMQDYVIKPEACTPEFEDEGGIYIEGFDVPLSCHAHHHGIPGQVHYLILPADDYSADPDETSPVWNGTLVMDIVGNQTIKAVTIGDHVLPSKVVQSPFYTIVPDPKCPPNEYEPHTGLGKAEVEWDIFERNCKPCPEGGVSPYHSKGIQSCEAGPGYLGPPGGPFHKCPLGVYKDHVGETGGPSWYISKSTVMVATTTCTKCPDLSRTQIEGADDITACKADPGAQVCALASV